LFCVLAFSILKTFIPLAVVRCRYFARSRCWGWWFPTLLAIWWFKFIALIVINLPIIAIIIVGFRSLPKRIRGQLLRANRYQRLMAKRCSFLVPFGIDAKNLVLTSALAIPPYVPTLKTAFGQCCRT
jgi:hypothetical protein